jgi:putative FmdB family regulatory protein
MPTYQYRCAECGEEFELWQSIHDDSLTRHPGCGGTVTKVFAPAGIVLKGSGFYRTDSRAAGRKRSGESKDKEPAKDGASASGNGAGGDGKGSSGSKDSKESTGSKDGSARSKTSKDAKRPTGETSKSGSSST